MPNRHRLRILLGWLLIGASLWLVACAGQPQGAGMPANASEGNADQPERDRPVVVTSIYPLYAFARAVGGDRIEAVLLLEPGMHAHDFEPTPRDLERILAADLLLYNGAGFEPWIERVISTVQAQGGPRVVDVSAGIRLRDAAAATASTEVPPHGGGSSGADGAPRPSPGHDEHLADDRHEHASGQADPHVWLDPQRAQKQVEAILQALQELDPEGAEGYAARARALQDELAEIDAALSAGLAQCRHRELVVPHAAFGYLADRYDLRQIAIGGLAPEIDPSPQELARLAAHLRDLGVRVVFSEALLDDRVVKTLAAEIGAEVLPLHPLENLSAEEAARGESYRSLMLQNLEHLRQGLECR